MMELRHNTARENSSGGLSKVRTPGQHLQDGRGQAGLDVETVASKLNISPGYVRFIEEDRYDKLPGEPFILGYMRSYARLVGVSSEAIIKRYRDYRRQFEQVEEPITAAPPPQNDRPAALIQQVRQVPKALHNHLKIIAILAALLLVWWIGSGIFGGSDSAPAGVETPADGQPSSPAEQNSTPQDTVPQNTTPQNTTPATPGPDATPTEAPEDGIEYPEDAASQAPELAGRMPGFADLTEITVMHSTEAKNSLASNDRPLSSMDLDRLSLRFLGECWLEVIDARGDVLATDLFQKGQSLQLRGEAPFNVLLGNVNAARVQLNDMDITLVAGDKYNRLKTTIGKP